MNLRDEILARAKRAAKAGRDMQLSNYELRLLLQSVQTRHWAVAWFLRLFDVPANWLARRRYRVHP